MIGEKRKQCYSDDFRGKDLSFEDLEEADLSNQNLQGTDFTGANLSRANLENADVREAIFTEADMQDADLTGVIGLTAHQMMRANLAGAKLPEAIAAFDGLDHVEATAGITRPLFILNVRSILKTDKENSSFIDLISKICQEYTWYQSRT